MDFLEGASNFVVFFSVMLTLGIAFSFRPIARRLLRADKMSFFAYDNYLNATHKRFEWTFRISGLVGILVLFTFQMFVLDDGGELKWYLSPYVAILAVIPFTELLRAYMEWKHAENRNNYKVTLLELGYLTIITVIFFATGFFGAFNFGWVN
ncbi:DUF4181 domain-containing protein [Jeotgalibacillus salarius]|uniref:DUF4181 domain-containing protein n=1 Tax=Jeotgalibacillus salarius TaxID=546023 RepID=A0A4Y8LNQ7_9BACL|nr:DUF4181 domain-containing protein [Jeotgalibacillus salarius]TFE02403.1 DUF4181 domain-containing protein [Jeotgalibacillus salarius]